MRIAVHDYAGHPAPFDLSRSLAARGHQVTHFFFAGDKGPKGRTTVQPHDPPGYAVEPVDIAQDYKKGDFVSRWRNDRAYGRRLAGQVAAFRPDVVISGNTPLDSQTYLLAAAKQQDAAFVFWMQDFYSRAISGILRDRWLGAGRAIAAHYTRLERAQVRASDAVVLISPDFEPAMRRWGVQQSKLSVIPNWGALSDIAVRPKENAWAKGIGADQRFVFLYSGTLGLKHDPELLLHLADSFSSDPEVRIVVAASGLGRDRLAAALAQRDRPNLLLQPLQPLNVFPDMLGSADVLVALLEADAGEFSMPSKILSYFCAERPLIVSAPPENMASRTTARIGAGLVTPPGDKTAFFAAAQSLRHDSALRRSLGRAGRAYAEATFDIELITDQFEALFDRFRAGRSRSAESRTAMMAEADG